ncbi:fec operon regulator FecR [compost metagenome]
MRLLEGELQLTVARDTRPLQLLGEHGLLNLSSGRYNLRQFAQYSQLTVFEGSASLAGNLLPSGQQARFNGPQWQASQALDSNVGAWVDGMLVAAHMPLGAFLDELGRYRRGQLNCAPEVANLLISGSYPLADSERILDMLEVALPVRVRRFTRYWMTVEARA